MKSLRIGHGYDVHAFADAAPNSAIVLGGVSIPFDKPLLAHSDGDVLIHALCDALLGALALGDIGQHFPDTDARYRDISSRELLSAVVQLLADNHYGLSNADMTIVAERPKMAAFIPAMREHIAADTGVSISDIGIKATTTEGLGFVGNQQGIACYASVIVTLFQ